MAWTLNRDHNPAVKVKVAECAHRRVATGSWGTASEWTGGYQNDVALWVMRASPVGEGWARAAAVWCVERLWVAEATRPGSRILRTRRHRWSTRLQSAWRRRRPAATTLGWQL